MRVMKRNRKRGQTTLEYALVVGVIAVGVILLGKHVFGKKDGLAHNLLKKTVQHAETTFVPGQNP